MQVASRRRPALHHQAAAICGAAAGLQLPLTFRGACAAAPPPWQGASPQARGVVFCLHSRLIRDTITYTDLFLQPTTQGPIGLASLGPLLKFMARAALVCFPWPWLPTTRMHPPLLAMGTPVA